MWQKPYSKIQSNSCEKPKNKTAGGKLKETVVFSCKRGGMYLTTEIKHLISATDKVQEYDENVKSILAHKIVLAHILAGAVKEFFQMKPEEIIPYIEGEPEIGKISLEPGLTNISSKIHGNNTVDIIPNEGYIYYDIKFYVRYPVKMEGRVREQIKLLLDIEAQKDMYPGYDIVTRGIYYNARQISAQKGTEFEHSDYDSIKKVYWQESAKCQK